MFFMKFVIVITMAFVVFTILELVVRKVFQIRKPAKNRPRYINKFHMWGESVLFSAFILSYFFVIVQYLDESWIPLWVPIFVMVIQLFRAFVEWEYQPQHREYIIHLLAVFSIMIFVFLAETTDWIEQLF